MPYIDTHYPSNNFVYVMVRPEDARREAAERAGGEGVGGDLPLEGPEAAVGGEEAAAEEVLEGEGEARALDVVGEAGPEEVVDDRRVGGGDAGAEAEGAAHLDGGGRGGGEEVGGPVEESVAVAEEGQGVAEDGVWVGAVVVGGGAAPEVEEEGGEEEQKQKQKRCKCSVHDHAQFICPGS
uniref:Uncharacterized protein n=1 Tax=Oryza barthii TaxID=65489 RepID=A0A0D3EYQ7_9ORYZ